MATVYSRGKPVQISVLACSLAFHAITSERSIIIIAVSYTKIAHELTLAAPLRMRAEGP